MTATRVRLFKRAAILALLMTGVLQGCGSTPEKPTATDKPPIVERPVQTYGPLELPASKHAAAFEQAEQAIAAFFGIIRPRDLEEFLVPVKTFAVTWKTAPEVSG